MGKRWSREKGSFWKHLHIEHTCICGKLVKGNGFYNHARVCKLYQASINTKEREQRTFTHNPYLDNLFGNPGSVDRG